MNRRTFLAALGVTACTGPTSTQTTEPRKPEPAPAGEPAHGSLLWLEPSPLATHGDVLVQQVGDELWRWDLRTMRRTDVSAFEGVRAMTFLADGSLAVLANSAKGCVVHRVHADGRVDSHLAPAACGRRPMLFRAATSDAVYVFSDDALQLYRFAALRLAELGEIEVPEHFVRQRGQTFGLDDGRVVGPGQFDVLEVGKPTRHLAFEGRLAWHRARATGDRLWYTYEDAKARWGVDVLALASLDAPAKELVALRVTPARIVHVASHGAAIAIVLVTRDARWSVAVVEETGAERWRVALPAERAGHFALGDVAAIAMTGTRVVLRGLADQLVAWDAATGSSVPVEPLARDPR